ncbi:MAG: hypothetical protein IKX06_05375 [Clostridia bacterium]|nr:hypothetical protein [Clostridia bacterium]
MANCKLQIASGKLKVESGKIFKVANGKWQIANGKIFKLKIANGKLKVESGKIFKLQIANGKLKIESGKIFKVASYKCRRLRLQFQKADPERSISWTYLTIRTSKKLPPWRDPRPGSFPAFSKDRLSRPPG